MGGEVLVDVKKDKIIIQSYNTDNERKNNKKNDSETKKSRVLN